ncbi:hypothetical protein NJH78_00585 [Pseudomonas chlororaphis]|uniref:hypothetical protein n=1 Tax=Pseudomonas chlororaphis TaxID=587753 RepID=UPI00209B53C0|nr:hypothetical protein [Pseudomonas chlororaphis]MCO7568460.1 hypothetical protein [Pseudomonas chlororaphis]MCO7588303.1 hypothetical protein [Pseudomonas chlororaphis]
MTHLKLTAIALLIPLAGCSVKNLKAPDYVDLSKPVLADPTQENSSYADVRLWPVLNLKRHYIPYRNGANTNKATLDSAALGGAGVAAIGAATQSKSEVYKASAAIIATALGLQEWGNFKQQSKLYEGAINYLECAESSSKVIILYGATDFTSALDNITAKKNEMSAAYDRATQVRALELIEQDVPPDLKTHATFTPRIGEGFEPDIRDLTLYNALADAESEDILNAKKIVLNHPLRISTDVEQLQTEISQAVEGSAFDTQKSVGTIVPKKAVGGATSLAESAAPFYGSQVDALTAAHLVIDAYNKYEKCSTKITQPALK